VPQSAYAVNAGLKVSMPILDAGAAQNQADAATRQNAVYAIQETQLQKSITSDITTAWNGVQIAREKRDLAQAQADLTALQLEIVKTQFDKGTAANQDLLTAAANDANARNVLGAAGSAVQLALLQLLNVMGY
jgi:outer membrane protein TolC